MVEYVPLLAIALLCFGIAFSITYFLIPKIVWVAREKELVVKPDHRSSHRIITPSFGGVAFFICFILCYSVLSSEYAFMHSSFVIPAVTLLFIVGLKDDLVVSSARAKLIGQLMAVAFLFLNPDFSKISLHGFLGVDMLSAWVSVPLVFIFMVGFINAYNLIDGIDGLAAFLGIIIFGAMGTVFYLGGEDFYFLVCTLLIGSLLAFIRFNFSKKITHKIFMGDTGSLFIGFLIAFLSLKVLAMDPEKIIGFELLPENFPLLVMVILSIPIFDTFRIMLVRKMTGKGIFVPDRNHVHHILIDLGLTHFKTSVLLSALLLVLIFSTYLLGTYFGWPVLLLFICLLAVMAYTVFHFLKSKVKPFRIKRKKLKARLAFFQGFFY
ncbi:glycosyltransferase family 4 protein [Anditalea andensis]|uniref:Glycosyl transferase n=1 Tax=Anditalea andensis TaxID=1048983 RepID=A0A074KQJ1_9BACT|nr:MraY family glycosyltransferase [Anditalea andensis]KEO72211.1 hypothetical protein EL17_20115 [Anditalea andensis]